MTAQSATLAIDAIVRARRRAGQPILHLGFGEARLPVPPGLTGALADAANRNSYGPVAGDPAARAAAGGWFTRRGLGTGPEQTFFGPGSKPLLFALLAAIGGDVVLPRPSWVSYAAQAALLDRRVIGVPVPARAGGVPDPERLERALRKAMAEGAVPKVMILTVPDNPTGTVASPAQVEAVCAIAERHGLSVISDEIYAELSYGGPVPSPAPWLPERTVVTTGLSKSLALGGWRIGFARIPDSAWGRDLRTGLTGIASEIWSSASAPMQAVAEYALSDAPELVAYIARSRRLHARVATALHQRVTAAGPVCRAPRAGFYLYPDLGPARAALSRNGVGTGAALAASLLDRHGIAALPGSAFGDSATSLTLRLATSMMYGAEADERRAALDAEEPERLPWISGALDQVDAAFRALVEGGADGR